MNENLDELESLDIEYSEETLAMAQQELEELNKNIEQNPNDDTAYYKRAMYYVSSVNTDYNLAIKDLTKVIELNPKNEEAYHWRAKLNMDLQQAEDSVLSDMKSLFKLNDYYAHESYVLYKRNINSKDNQLRYYAEMHNKALTQANNDNVISLVEIEKYFANETDFSFDNIKEKYNITC